MEDKYYSYNQYGSNVATSTTTKEFAKSYLWMFLGMMITFIVGFLSSSIVSDLIFNQSGKGNFVTVLIFFIIILIFQSILVSKINRQALVQSSFFKSLFSFIAYCALTGLTFSLIFSVFDMAILNQVFIGVAIYFLFLSLITFLFRNRIHKMSGIALAGLLVLLLSSLITGVLSFLLYGSETYFIFYLTVSILGILIFTIVSMVDIKNMHSLIDHAGNKKSAAVVAALILYLDFMNIFVYVLRILSYFLSRSSRND